MLNMAKKLQRVPLDVSIHWCYLHQDAGKTYSEISKMRSYWKYSKATICRHMKKNIGDLFEWFKNNHMKANADKCHLLVTRDTVVTATIGDFNVKNSRE